MSATMIGQRLKTVKFMADGSGVRYWELTFDVEPARQTRVQLTRFQPELVAINGSYRLADNCAAELADLRDRPLQARLEGTKMSIMPLD